MNYWKRPPRSYLQGIQSFPLSFGGYNGERRIKLGILPGLQLRTQQLLFQQML